MPAAAHNTSNVQIWEVIKTGHKQIISEVAQIIGILICRGETLKFYQMLVRRLV
jgi:hypothetical protein